MLKAHRRLLGSANFFTERDTSESQLPLSSLDKTSMGTLYDGILDLERIIMGVGHAAGDGHLKHVNHDQRFDKAWQIEDIQRSLLALKELKSLINSPVNRHGDLYKYWFDLSDTHHYRGNNVLLTSISRACQSLSDEHTGHVETMVRALLVDAERKLSPACFKQFIAFRYVPIKHESAAPRDYYFDNTPLTLSILAGLHFIAVHLLNTGLLLPEDVNVQMGQGYVMYDMQETVIKENPRMQSAAHIASLRLNVTRHEKELSVLTLLRDCGADFDLRDEYDHTAFDLAGLVIPKYVTNCQSRRNEMTSDYAAYLDFDSKIVDVYQQKDMFNHHEEEVKRHPDVYHPPRLEEPLCGWGMIEDFFKGSHSFDAHSIL